MKTKTSLSSRRSRNVVLPCPALSSAASGHNKPAKPPDRRAMEKRTPLVCHVRYAIFQMAAAALPREVFARILGLIITLDELLPWSYLSLPTTARAAYRCVAHARP